MAVLSMFLVALCCPSGEASCEIREHLFFIERSKNKNLVYYDVCLTDSTDLSDSAALTVYWILENGQEEELNPIERTYAYGINTQEKLERNKLSISLAALNGQKIIIEKVEQKFKALISVGNRQIVIEKVYINARDSLLGMPKVLYVDVFGFVRQENTHVIERIAP